MFKDMIDMKTFKAIVDNYGAGYAGGDLSNSVLEGMIDTHVKNKAHIFKLFGNKLRIEKEIDVVVPQHEAEAIMKGLALALLETNSKFKFAASLIRGLSADEFTSNIIKGDRQFFNVQIKSGTKVSKALTKLVLPEHEHQVLTAHSMVNQKLFTRGKVVLSIDPCDYVTMSSNSSGWKSCHRLNGGEYRTGPIAYLRDESSVICYVESSKACEFSLGGQDYKHSNKTWRQLALVSPDLTFAMQERQYPNHNSINQNAVSDLFRELFENLKEVEYKTEKASVKLLRDLHVDYANENDECALYYNDILNEMFDSANVVLPKGLSPYDLKDLDLPLKGAAVPCLSCGDYFDETDSLYCYDCRPDCDDDEW